MSQLLLIKIYNVSAFNHLKVQLNNQLKNNLIIILFLVLICII